MHHRRRVLRHGARETSLGVGGGASGAGRAAGSAVAAMGGICLRVCLGASGCCYSPPWHSRSPAIPAFPHIISHRISLFGLRNNGISRHKEGYKITARSCPLLAPISFRPLSPPPTAHPHPRLARGGSGEAPDPKATRKQRLYRPLSRRRDLAR